MFLLISLSLISDTSYVKKQLVKSDSLYFESYKDTALFVKAENILDSLILNSKVLMDEILWRKSHLCFERGYASKKNSKKKEWYERGEKFAELAIEKNPNNPEAHFWSATNEGSLGKLNGVLNSLFMVDDLKKEANTVIKLDSTHAGAKRRPFASSTRSPNPPWDGTTAGNARAMASRTTIGRPS